MLVSSLAILCGCGAAVRVERGPARPGAATAVVSSISGTKLEQQTASGWTTVCATPCNPTLDAGRYRLVAPRIDPVDLQVSGPGLQELRIDGNPTGRTAGAIVIGLGGLTIGVGYGLLLQSFLDDLCIFGEYCESDNSDEHRALAIMGAGLAAVAVGAYVAVDSRTKVFIRKSDGGVPVARVKLGHGLELSPHGLHF